MSAVHFAVTRHVKPGYERQFEEGLREFARESMREPGMTGVHLIAPAPGTKGREYGILRSFESEEASRQFYESDLFKKWQEQVAPMVVGEAVLRRLHGLEAFFREAGTPPPRWKMAIVTWFGVLPTVLVFSSLLRHWFPSSPPHVLLGCTTILAVITLTWGVMPFLTRMFAGWLQSRPLSSAGTDASPE